MVVMLCPLFATLFLSLAQVGGSWQADGAWTGLNPADGFGMAIAVSGDLDGDGIDDFVVGVRGADTPSLVDVGRVVAYSGATRNQLWERWGSGDTERFGYGLAPAADLDGDGVPDLLVRSHNTGVLRLGYSGRVTAVSGIDGSVIYEIDGANSNDYLGAAMVGVGDRDGDGVEDYALGSPGWSNPSLRWGSVQVVSGVSGQQIVQVNSTAEGVEFGSALAFVGDTNQDGSDEIAVGIPLASFGGAVHCGRVVILDLATGAIVRDFVGPNADDRFGSELLAVPDVNGDGIRELLVTSRLAGQSAGGVTLFELGGGQQLWAATGSLPGQRFGSALATCPDLDADGIQDLVIGAAALWASPLPSVELRSGKDGVLLHRIFGDPGSQFGRAVAVHTELEGSRAITVLCGAPEHAGPGPGEVEAHSFEPFLRLSQESFSVSSSGVLTFEIDFPSSEAGLAYRVLASRAGTGPTLWNALQVPLAADTLLLRILNGWTPPGAVGIAGVLNMVGDAAAVLPVPAVGAALAGQVVHFAVVDIVSPAVGGHLSSSAVRVVFLP